MEPVHTNKDRGIHATGQTSNPNTMRYIYKKTAGLLTAGNIYIQSYPTLDQKHSPTVYVKLQFNRMSHHVYNSSKLQVKPVMLRMKVPPDNHKYIQHCQSSINSEIQHTLVQLLCHQMRRPSRLLPAITR